MYNWIEAGELDRGADSKAVRYGPRPRRPSKLDPYKGIIDARLAEYPKLSAVRLFNEVRAAGYGGGYGQVKRYVRGVRPREPVEPVRRFETPPGHQGQVDFADFRLPWGKRHALIVVLGYSRRMWLRFYERQTMPVVMRGLEASFAYFGRRAVGVAVRPDEGRHHRRQAGRGRTADREPGVPALQPPLELPDPRMPPRTGPRRRGRSSGRSAISGTTSSTVRSSCPTTTSTRGSLLWLDGVANVRVHGTLKERVADRFERERSCLSPLAPWPYRPVVPRPEPWTRQTGAPSTPRVVDVERRPLSDYAGITGEIS